MTNLIPKNHPRAHSLYVRERLVNAFDDGLVAKEGLMAHGRGEAFDYLIGEKTSKSAKNAIKAAAFALVSAKHPVISVNGNIAGLCPREIIELSKVANAKIEINLFYANEKRKQTILKVLHKNGAKEILGVDKKNSTRISGLDSARRIVDRDGIYIADVVLVPLEDGDRTIALKKAGKKVITFDLNPLSRTAQTADITIVDNVVRGIRELIDACEKTQKKKLRNMPFDNKKNLAKSISEIRNYLTRRARIA
ncbi:4-phosphopantoate--beta-alanine ligase [Candidatus Nitrosotenuis chungbukensis]|uniref:4-phosphopantoate--beta-alanine ligase n=1 Tax=Candidatus Nitrosotenuis chungbukensis TaxID=1353246 RepID=UPI0005B2570B|nr:4-phosphopantoate--beta-alanine ligase [Candidatus Nitrosotenuis chungbukensis]